MRRLCLKIRWTVSSLCFPFHRSHNWRHDRLDIRGIRSCAFLLRWAPAQVEQPGRVYSTSGQNHPRGEGDIRWSKGPHKKHVVVEMNNWLQNNYCSHLQSSVLVFFIGCTGNKCRPTNISGCHLFSLVLYTSPLPESRKLWLKSNVTRKYQTSTLMLCSCYHSANRARLS